MERARGLETAMGIDFEPLDRKGDSGFELVLKGFFKFDSNRHENPDNTSIASDTSKILASEKASFSGKGYPMKIRSAAEYILEIGIAPTLGAARVFIYRHPDMEGIIRLGRKVFINPDKFDKWLESQEVKPRSPLSIKARRKLFNSFGV